MKKSGAGRPLFAEMISVGFLVSSRTAGSCATAKGRNEQEEQNEDDQEHNCPLRIAAKSPHENAPSCYVMDVGYGGVIDIETAIVLLLRTSLAVDDTINAST
jgi:hypothetical protein